MPKVFAVSEGPLLLAFSRNFRVCVGTCDYAA